MWKLLKYEFRRARASLLTGKRRCILRIKRGCWA